ncbi:hypothetical protein C8R48DRAFT_597330 [Suillus tomentosus]|nr:hypothetical protein C8R48DRAFT_597330 [Suillus tomentosus]
MTNGSVQSRRPTREAWTLECLLHERAIVLGFTLTKSTSASYDSAVASYIQFCRLHNVSLTPTPDTLSFYIVWMSAYILPSSVDSYLSGICNKLEEEFTEIRKVHHSCLVQRTLAGCKRRLNHPVRRKQPLSRNDLHIAFSHYHMSADHDDILFLAQLYFGFETLQRLGKLVWPDATQLPSYNVVPMRHTVHVDDNSASYILLVSKTDKFTTALVLAGVSPDMIQGAGRWSSDEFRKYIRAHPFILQAMIHES